MRTYKKPMITVDSGLAEGVYAASGAAKGTLNVTYYGVWDRWGTNGGKGLAMADWIYLLCKLIFDSSLHDTYEKKVAFLAKGSDLFHVFTTSYIKIN